jgi:hypothetical protein
MTTVVISPSNVADFPDGGGHFWVYMQYVQGLKRLGCDVYWLEHIHGSGDARRDEEALRVFLKRMRDFGLAEQVLIVQQGEKFPRGIDNSGELTTHQSAESVCARTDLLLNFSYAIDAELLSRFSKTALVDIDPGLLQFWISEGQIQIARYDIYFTTGETVGSEEALFPDCDISWNYMRPVVSLSDWPMVYDDNAQVLTTVSGWWGDEWISNGRDVLYQNNKRVSFMQFAELAARTEQALELALALGIKDSQDEYVSDDSNETDRAEYQGDAKDRSILENYGWRIRLASDVAGGPESYRNYIQKSRGEFSCAKPSCMRFQNAWVSDRSLCYLASGKPTIVQDTGPSQFLPRAEGMFRFRTIDEALAAIDAMNSDYALHCEAARALAETYFDAEKGMESLLNKALATSTFSPKTVLNKAWSRV